MNNIMTQKYTSIHQIDTEFIPSLEELLQDHIPSFDFIANYEKQADENIDFHYYLFFGNQTNAPIGFAQVNITKSITEKQNLLVKALNKSLFKKNKTKNSASWDIAGVSQAGIVFDPKYSQHLGEKTQEVFNQLFEKNNIETQKLSFLEKHKIHLEEKLSSDLITANEEQIVDSLLKNKSSYQEYLNSLSESLQKETVRTWRFVQKELSYKMGEYDTFKSIFHYKERGTEQIKEFKKILLSKNLNLESENISYLTFETNYEIKSLAYIIHGSCGHYFYDTIKIDDQLPEILPHHQVILKFYEHKDALRLHYLGQDLPLEYLTSLEFTLKKKFSVSVTKND